MDNFTMVHFPDLPQKRVLYSDIPDEKDCQQIFEEWKDQTKKAPHVRSQKADEYYMRMNRRLHKPVYDSSNPLPCRKGSDGASRQPALGRGQMKALPPLPLDLDRTTRNKRHHTAKMQRYQELQLRTKEPLGQDASALQHEPSRRGDGFRPAHPQYGRPHRTFQSRDTFLDSSDGLQSRCSRCQSDAGEDGGLCWTCTATFAISAVFDYERERAYTPSPRTPSLQLSTPRTGSETSSSGYTSSICTSDSGSVRFHTSASPEPWGGAFDKSRGHGSPYSIHTKTPSSDKLIPIIRQPSHGRGPPSKLDDEEIDLYDLDWAEYYFDEANFSGRRYHHVHKVVARPPNRVRTRQDILRIEDMAARLRINSHSF